jgi:hypothetical protein
MGGLISCCISDPHIICCSILSFLAVIFFVNILLNLGCFSHKYTISAFIFNIHSESIRTSIKTK